MRYAPDRAGSHLDVAASLKACPICLGDLVLRNEAAGNFYVCLQCQIRIEWRSGLNRAPAWPHIPALDTPSPAVGAVHAGLPFMI